NGALSGSLTLKNISVEEALKEANVSVPVTGTLGGSVRLAGSIKDPQGEGDFDLEQPVIRKEKLDRIRGAFRVTSDLIELTNVMADSGPAHIRLSGGFSHPAGDFKSGDVRFQMNAQGISPDRI